MSQLILLRHGQSLWNKKGLFTGWIDVPLSIKGIEEAQAAGLELAQIEIHEVHVSDLMRAKMTAMIACTTHPNSGDPQLLNQYPRGSVHEQWSTSQSNVEPTLPVFSTRKLNERMYGDLQGKNKQQMTEKFGEKQVKIWRRSYEITPPGGENLILTAERTIPYFNKEILPSLEDGRNVLIVAHTNSLRSIVMHLEGLNAEEIFEVEVPTGQPIMYMHDASKHTFTKV